MDSKEQDELFQEYVRAVLGECRLLYWPAHIVDTMDVLLVQHDPGSATRGEGYSVFDKGGHVRLARVTVADLGDSKYSMEEMKQCVLENRSALLLLHSYLMDVHDSVGEGEGGPATLPSYEPAVPASHRVSPAATFFEASIEPEVDSQPRRSVPQPRKTFDELMTEYEASDPFAVAVESVEKGFPRRGPQDHSRRRSLESDEARNVDGLGALDEWCAASGPATHENAEIEESAKPEVAAKTHGAEQAPDEPERKEPKPDNAAIEESAKPEVAAMTHGAEQAPDEPERKEPKAEKAGRVSKFPELHDDWGEQTEDDEEFELGG